MEADEPAVPLGEEEAVRVKPRFPLTLVQIFTCPATLLGVMCECTPVQLDPGRLVAAGRESADRDPLGENRPVERGLQGAPHLPQGPDPLETGRSGQPRGGGQITMSPQPDWPAAGRCHEGIDELRAEAATAQAGVHHEFAARALDRVGRVQVRVSGELAACMQQQVARPRVAAVPQVQHDVLGERPDPVLVRGRGGEPQHGTRVQIGQPALHGDTVGRGSGLGSAVGRGPRLGWTACRDSRFGFTLCWDT